MAYKLKIKHNCPGKTLPLTLVYNADPDDTRTYQEIPVEMTSNQKVVSLAAWNLTPDEMDVSKIGIKEQTDGIVETYAIYHIKNVNIVPES